MRVTAMLCLLTFVACGRGNTSIASTLSKEQGLVLATLQVVPHQQADLALHVAQSTFLFYGPEGEGICFGFTPPADLTSCTWTDRVGLPRESGLETPIPPFIVRLPNAELYRVEVLTFAGTATKDARVDLDVQRVQ